MRYAVDYIDGLGFPSGDPYLVGTRWGARRKMRALRLAGITAPLIVRGARSGRFVESLPSDPTLVRARREAEDLREALLLIAGDREDARSIAQAALRDAGKRRPKR